MITGETECDKRLAVIGKSVPSSIGATDRVGLREIKFHTLRHEGTCRLFEAGLQIQEVALITGHQSWNILRRYTHLKPENILEKLK